MNPAFERHAAYLDQAWRTLEDSVLLKRQETHAQRQNRLMAEAAARARALALNTGGTKSGKSNSNEIIDNNKIYDNLDNAFQTQGGDSRSLDRFGSPVDQSSSSTTSMPNPALSLAPGAVGGVDQSLVNPHRPDRGESCTCAQCVNAKANQRRVGEQDWWSTLTEPQQES